MPLNMKGKRKRLEYEIKQLLEDTRAENDALKKLIIALQEEEIKKKSTKRYSEESSHPHIN